MLLAYKYRKEFLEGIKQNWERKIKKEVQESWESANPKREQKGHYVQ